MNEIEGKYRVSSWVNFDELNEVYKKIFHPNSSIDDRKQAHLKLQTWKIRTGQDTQAGILCTLILLDVQIKDITGMITDPFTLSTLYASSFTKFINYATSFQYNEATMYRSAHKLGLESFLIDLRHLCAHGKSLPSVEVFRKSTKLCFNWIENYYWKRELENVSDGYAENMRRDLQISKTLEEIFIIYDSIIELLHNNVKNIQEDGKILLGRERLEVVERVFEGIKVKNLFLAMKMLTANLNEIIGTKEMMKNPSTFFQEMFDNCQYFMSTTAEDNQSFISGNVESDMDTSQESRDSKKLPRYSAVNLYQFLIYQIARQGFLKNFVDELHIINSTETEHPQRRASAGFWICTILDSFQYYQKYLQFSKEDWTKVQKITSETKKIYSYQLDAELRKTLIFVGSQMTQTTFKYSMEHFQQMLQDLTEENFNVCISVIPFVYPKLSDEQVKQIKNLIDIKMQKNESETTDFSKIFTVNDLIMNGESAMMEIETENEFDKVWQKSLDDIEWRHQPIGKDVSLLQD